MNESIQRQDRNKFRRSLKEIQLSADERFVGNSMICPDDKVALIAEQSKTVGKVIVAEKENAPAVRRSKRKTAAENVVYVESPVELKPSKSKNTQAKKTITKSKKKRPIAVKKNEKKTAQTKLNFSTVTTDTINGSTCTSHSDDHEKKLSTVSTGIDEDSGFDPTCGISDHSPMNSTVISKAHDVKSSSAIPNNISIITAESPPLNYWKNLAEERRVALEKVLHENELLHDQLEVLEAENTKLKEEVKIAENLAEALRGILD